jgi:hypothetical protein
MTEPIDPGISEGANQVRQFFIALQIEGFTEEQALRMAIALLTKRAE